MFFNLVISSLVTRGVLVSYWIIGHEYDVGVTVAPVAGVVCSTVQAPSVGC